MTMPSGVRVGLAACALVAVVATGLSCTQSGSAPSPKRPNILFVLTDDLSRDEVAHMPNLKRLLTDQGTTFSNYFVSVSLCCPSRATTLRGQYAHNTGIETNSGSTGGFATAHSTGIESSTIATWLQAAGYQTALIGKYLNGYPNGASDTYVPPGWSEWDSASRRGSAYDEFNYTLNENGRLVRYGRAPQEYGTDVYTNKAVDFITKAAKDGKPFFTYLSVYAPHQPATPAPRHADLFPDARAARTASFNEADVSDKPEWVKRRSPLVDAQQRSIDALYRKRLQSLQAVDDAIATLVRTLIANHQLDDTYILFTSDNGFHLGQHRLPAGKQTAYEEDIHVPLVVRGPHVPAGRTQAAITGNVDLAPTFADLAGATAPDFVDGRSFGSLLHGDGGDRRQAYLLEHGPTSRSRTASGAAPDPSTEEPADPDQADADRAEPDQAGVGFAAGSVARGSGVAIPSFRGIRTTRYTYVEYVTGERELYDLRSDRDQLHNIAATADGPLLAQLSQRVTRLRTCKAAQCRTVEDQPIP